MQRPPGQTLSHRRFVLRVNIAKVSHVVDDRHPGVWNQTHGRCLGRPEFGQLKNRVTSIIKRRQLHKIEGEIA
jgi:hypothetical protein